MKTARKKIQSKNTKRSSHMSRVLATVDLMTGPPRRNYRAGLHLQKCAYIRSRTYTVLCFTLRDMSTTIVLNQNWEFSQLSEQEAVEWLPVTQFPTSVHVELLKAGKIPDPVGMMIYIRLACLSLFHCPVRGPERMGGSM